MTGDIHDIHNVPEPRKVLFRIEENNISHTTKARGSLSTTRATYPRYSGTGT